MGGVDKKSVKEFSYLAPTCLALDDNQEANGSLINYCKQKSSVLFNCESIVCFIFYLIP